MFDKKGVFTFDREKYTEDQLMEVGLEAGPKTSWTKATAGVHTAMTDFDAVRQALKTQVWRLWRQACP